MVDSLSGQRRRSRSPRRSRSSRDRRSHHPVDTKHHKSHRRHRSHSTDSHRSHSPSSSPRRVKSTVFRVTKKAEPFSSRCIGVFGMNFATTEQKLIDIFKPFGFIDHIRLARHHVTGRSRGFAFIYYDKIECADRAKRRLNNTAIDGHRVRIEFAHNRRSP